jgi:hypothetical protein
MQDADPAASADVDAEIEKELAEMRQPSSEELFTSVRLDTQCRQSFSVILAYRFLPQTMEVETSMNEHLTNQSALKSSSSR